MKLDFSKNKLREGIELFIICVLSLAFIFIGNKVSKFNTVEKFTETVETATVVGDISVSEDTENLKVKIVKFKGKITSGILKGETVSMEQRIDEIMYPVPEMVKKGDKILIASADMMGIVGGDVLWYYAGVNRVPSMALLGLLFLGLVLLIGRFKGVRTAIALCATVSSVFFVLIPSILSGKNIYIATTIVTVFIILSSLLILNGFNKKSLCAIVGNIGGVAISGALALAVNALMGITGMVDQDYIFLMVLDGNISIDLKAVVWCGIIVGSVGAVMDVAMSLASSMNELSEQMKNRSFASMVRSGMNIGKDAIGTMTNTLILAYVGSSLAVILLFAAYNRDVLAILNYEMVVVEFIQGVVGSIGILLAVPATVLFSSWIFNLKGKNSDEAESSYGGNEG